MTCASPGKKYEQVVRPYQSKSLLRRALRDLLPPEICNRKGKARNADAFARAGQREKSRLQMMLAEGRACADGYLNPTAMQAAIANDVLCSPVILLGPFEHWLQSLQQRKLTTSPQHSIRKFDEKQWSSSSSFETSSAVASGR